MKPEPPHEKHRQRPADHRVGVACPEFVREPLARRLQLLRRLDEPDDFLQSALRRQPHDAELDDAPQVERAAEHLIAHALLHRIRLTRQRRFVTRTLAVHHDSVRRKRLARLHAHVLANLQHLDGDFLFRSVRQHEVGALRRSFQQRAHLALRAVQRVFLHRARRGKQKQQQHRLAPRADEHRADGHRKHEKMDVDLTFLEIRPRIDTRVPTARRQPHEKKTFREPRISRREPTRRHSRESRHAAHRGQLREQSPFLILGRGLGLDLRPLHLAPPPHPLRRHARVAPDHRRVALPPQRKPRRRARRALRRELLLDRGNGRRERFLQPLDLDVAHRCDGNAMGRGIDAHRAHAGLLAQETHERPDPIAPRVCRHFHDREVSAPRPNPQIHLRHPAADPLVGGLIS